MPAIPRADKRTGKTPRLTRVKRSDAHIEPRQSAPSVVPLTAPEKFTDGDWFERVRIARSARAATRRAREGKSSTFSARRAVHQKR